MEQEAHYIGHRKRLKERLLADPKQLADYELLELFLGQVLLRQDTKPLAKRLIARFGSLRGVLQAPSDELTQESGVGAAVATQWLLQQELFARYMESPVREKRVYSHPKIIADMARARLASCSHEEVWVAFLDNQHHLLAWKKASQGTVNTSDVYPRDIMEAALKYKASCLVLVHNHPSGSCKSSAGDKETTSLVARSAATLGIVLLDHIIITADSYYSMQEHREL